jgi:hypothetical protein
MRQKNRGCVPCSPAFLHWAPDFREFSDQASAMPTKFPLYTGVLIQLDGFKIINDNQPEVA